MNVDFTKHFISKSTKKLKLNNLRGSLPIISKGYTLKETIPTDNSKLFLKNELDDKLTKLFSSESSLMGYKYDIEYILNELYIKKEDLLNIVLEFLSKSNKKEDEIRIIASYLFSMQGLTNLLLKTINLDVNKINKEKHLLNNLLVLGSTLVYEKFPKNYVLIRFGEKGSKAYINLSGSVAVLIKKAYKLLLTEDEYLHYLANLIRYNEYEMVNLVVNENYKIFPIKIFDDINEQDYSKRGLICSWSNKDINRFSNLNNKFCFENIGKNNSILGKKSSKDVSLKKLLSKSNEKLNKTKKEQRVHKKFKLTQENEKTKETQYKIYASVLLENNNIKMVNKKSLNKCTVEEYINRINVIKGFEYNEEEYNKKNAKEKDRAYFSIYSYIKVVELPKGSLFGEMALNHKNSQRNATLITLDECYCGVLNKKTYDNCLKNGAEKNLHDILYFIVELPIFKGIPTSIFFKKYYTSLSRNSINKCNKIINQGEKPEYIILLKSGQYVINAYDSLYNITNLMIHYIKINKKLKNKKNIINKVLLMIKETNKLLMENELFKNYYFSKNIYKVGVISSPDIIGYNEYLDQNGLYAFNIEPVTLKNDVFLLKNAFYEDIIKKNEIVKNNQEEIFYSKLDLLFERLYNTRNTEINTFLDYRAREEIGVTIKKEINGLIDDRIKFKRVKKFNNIDYKIKIKNYKAQNNRNINLHSENNYLESNKKSNVSNKQSKGKIPLLSLKENFKTETNIDNSNNINTIKNENSKRKIVKFSKFIESTDNKDKLYSYNQSKKNKTITYFPRHKLKINKLNKSKNEKIKTEKNSNSVCKNKKEEFDGICLNNMILEDIKGKIKFSLNDDKKIIHRNKSKNIKKYFFSELYNSDNNYYNKNENEKSIPPINKVYLKTTPLNIKKDKKEENTNKINNSNRNIFNLKQYNEKEKINYDIERSNYYKKTVSKRINLFFGTKKFYNI